MTEPDTRYLNTCKHTKNLLKMFSLNKKFQKKFGSPYVGRNSRLFEICQANLLQNIA